MFTGMLIQAQKGIICTRLIERLMHVTSDVIIYQDVNKRTWLVKQGNFVWKYIMTICQVVVQQGFNTLKPG